MNREEKIELLKEIFNDVFDYEGDFSETLSPETLEEWDSLGHINLMVAVQSEFKIEFDMDEMQNNRTVGSILKSLENKGL